MCPPGVVIPDDKESPRARRSVGALGQKQGNLSLIYMLVDRFKASAADRSIHPASVLSSRH